MTTDTEADAFLAQDLSDLDFSQFKPISWETAPKSARINMRLPQALKAKAAKRGIPQQAPDPQALERELARP